MNLNLFNGLASANMLVFLASVVVHIAFAIGVQADATASIQQKKGLFLTPPWVWSLATLIAGVPIVAVYWLIHHSTLRR